MFLTLPAFQLYISRSTRITGFTVIELMITVAIVSVLAAIAVPQLNIWIQRNSLNSAAEAIQNGLRMAEAEAIRRNAPVQFLLSNTVPSSSVVTTIVPVAGGSHWMIRQLDSTYAPLLTGYIGGYRYEGDPNMAITSSTGGGAMSSLVFNGLGRTLTAAGAAMGANAVFRVDLAATNRRLCVYATPAGAIRMCNPNLTAGDPRACQPALTAAECPVLLGGV